MVDEPVDHGGGDDIVAVKLDAAGNVTSTDWQGSNAGCYDAQQKLAGKG